MAQEVKKIAQIEELADFGLEVSLEGQDVPEGEEKVYGMPDASILFKSIIEDFKPLDDENEDYISICEGYWVLAQYIVKTYPVVDYEDQTMKKNNFEANYAYLQKMMKEGKIIDYKPVGEPYFM
jgi:hypothetical protein